MYISAYSFGFMNEENVIHIIITLNTRYIYTDIYFHIDITLAFFLYAHLKFELYRFFFFSKICGLEMVKTNNQ